MLQDKVFVGLDSALGGGFDVTVQIVGPNGTHLEYIAQESGGAVSLRGRGSGFIEPHLAAESTEPMHLLIE